MDEISGLFVGFAIWIADEARGAKHLSQTIVLLMMELRSLPLH